MWHRFSTGASTGWKPVPHFLNRLRWEPRTPINRTATVRERTDRHALGARSSRRLVRLRLIAPVCRSDPCDVLATVPKSGPVFGATLLASYSIGHCGLILVGGTSMGMVQRLVDSRGWNRGIAVIRRGVGVLIILVGLGVLWMF